MYSSCSFGGKGSLGAVVKAIALWLGGHGFKSWKQTLAKIAGKGCVQRPQVVRPFSGPAQSGSFMHWGCPLQFRWILVQWHTPFFCCSILYYVFLLLYLEETICHSDTPVVAYPESCLIMTLVNHCGYFLSLTCHVLESGVNLAM
jgi:hypothetical protein